MTRRLAICAALLFVTSAFGCSLALDIEELQKGTPEPQPTDTGDPPCEGNADCDDGVDCTDDVCEADGSCTIFPNNDNCPYLFVCDPIEGCISSGKECLTDDDCNDGISCTEDACENFQCVHDANDALCESDNPCILAEECDEETGCTEGVEMVCDQSGAPCMHTACNPENGECEDTLMAGANDDGDAYLDADCGGDDCDDSDENIFPGATELCNYDDDDCDGLTDIAASAVPVSIYESSLLEAPAIAFDGTHYLLAWQVGSGTASEIYCRFLDAAGAAVSDPVNLTSIGGSGSHGASPAVAVGDGEFLAAWVTRVGSADPDVVLTGLTVDGGDGTVTPWVTPVMLATGSATALASPALAYDDNTAGSGWVVGWIGTTGTDIAVAVEVEDMHSHPTATFTVSSGTTAVQGLTIAVVGENEYLVSYAREDTASDSDLELFESLMTLVTDAWDQTGYPALVSAANASATDPSVHPAVATDGAGNPVTVYTDVAAFGANSNIYGWDGSSLTAIIEDSSTAQLEPALAWNGTDQYGMLFITDVGSARALDFKHFDAALSVPANQASRLATATGADDVRSGKLVADGAGGYGAAWIHTDDDTTTDSVVFAVFEGCTPTGK